MSVKKILIDPRWKNAGGIGTFYEKINEINRYDDIQIEGSPASPLDTLRSAKAMSTVKDAVVFFPGYIPPLVSNLPYVFTVHDLNHLDRPENSSLSKKIFYNTIIKNGCRKAEYIFTVSEFSRQRIIEWTHVAADKVINVGNGVSPHFTPQGDSINYAFEFLLCVSNRKLHKNEEGVIKAFHAADIDKEIKLVFTGKPSSNIENLIASLGLKDRVVFTGFIESADLPKLYRSAKALVFPSFYEGFGLPVIEAQASGIPVITSSTTSLGEVSGGAALLVDPYSVPEIASAIEVVCHDANRVNKLTAEGLINSKKYTWERTAGIVDKYIKKIS
ncbi:TPA: glycosyltransferase family 4 protein [Citrobacter freundii]